MNNDTKLKVYSLGGITIIMIMANTMLFPIFPDMRRAMELNLEQISLMVLIVALPAAILSPVGGILADIWGRKKIIVPSMLLYGIAGGSAGLAIILGEQPYYTVLFFRLLQGIGSAAPMYLAVALAGDIFQSSQRTKTMGFIETSNGLGKLLSPIIGGAAGMIAWYAPFFIYPLVSIPAALIVWIFIKESPPQQKISLRSELTSCSHLLRLSSLLPLVTGLLAVLFLFGTMFWIGKIIDKQIPDGTIIYGLVISLPVAALMITTYFSSPFTSKIGARLTLFTGLFIAGISLVLIPLTFGTFLLWLNVVLLGIGAGLLLPMLDTIATAVAERGHRGIITNIFGGFRSLGAAVAPYFIALLLDRGLFATFLPIAAGCFSLGGIILALARDEDMLPPKLREN